ncbi:GntR family transcriptional regulator [Aeromicrobium sp. YIM 150415]|nr:GntR family transcriptional regulator [Aeromicrobium sp. YIM 150415]
MVEQEMLARELGVSTTPLREALRRLEAEGFLHQVAHREMRVAPLSLKELEDLYALRIRLESYGAQLGTKNASDQERALVLKMLEEPIADDMAGHLKQNRALHRAMYSAGGNVELTAVLDRLWDRADRYRAILLRDQAVASTVHAEHIEIVEAFQKGDGRLIARLTRSHLEAGRASLLGKLPAPTV